MSVSLRDLSANDIDACLGIVKEIYTGEQGDVWQEILPKDLSYVLNKTYPSKCLVAIKNDTIVGFGCYVKLPESTDPNIYYKLSWINITPSEQGNGIGKKIVGALEKDIENACKEAFSVILETDKPGFYNKLGYTTYHKDGNNDLMQKAFPPKISFPKILIGTLFSEVKNYAIKEWFKNVCQLTYPNFDLCLVDNSKDKKYHKKMFKYFSEHKKNSNIGKLTILHTPRTHKKSEVFLTFSANELRKHFLKGDYDFLFNLECDIFPPSDIIERLLCYNKPVIGATYFSGVKDQSYPMIVELLTMNTDEDLAFHNPPYIKGFFEMTDTFEPKPYFGQGIGVCLWHRSVIEKIPFRTVETTFYDSVFYVDLYNNGIQNYLVPIICRHENQLWEIQKKMIGQ